MKGNMNCARVLQLIISASRSDHREPDDIDSEQERWSELTVIV